MDVPLTGCRSGPQGVEPLSSTLLLGLGVDCSALLFVALAVTNGTRLPLVLVAAAGDFLYDDLAKDLGGARLLDFFCCLGVAAAVTGEGAADVSPGRKLAPLPAAAATALVALLVDPATGLPTLFPFITWAMLMLPSPASLAPFFVLDFAKDLGTETTSFGKLLLSVDLAVSAWPAPAIEAAEPFNDHEDFVYDFGLLLAAELPFPENGAGCRGGMPNAPPPALPAVTLAEPLKEVLAKDFRGDVALLAAGIAAPLGEELLLVNNVAAIGATEATWSPSIGREEEGEEEDKLARKLEPTTTLFCEDFL